MKILKITLLAYILFSVFSCEDVVDVDLEDGVRQVVVDAFLTNEFGPQTVKLSRTVPFFEAVNTPPITGATVTVTDDGGNVFNFLDNTFTIVTS